MRHCGIHNLDYFAECLPCTQTGEAEWLFEYCPSCAGDLDTGYECTKCGRDWQSYVHDAALRVETETKQ